MRIAQHSVAGEVVVRPQKSELPSVEQDQQALDEYACDRSNLPWVIFRAAHRATHTSALPARARALLAALARTVDASKPFAAIFARRELLTGRAMQSMRTFYRSLDDLESAGFISRPPQMRYGSAGLFGRAYLHLTSRAANLLGLVEPDADSESSPTVPRMQSVGTCPELSLAPPCATLADGAIYKDLNPTHQKRQPGRIPSDLQRLLPLGFREFLIFKLMSEAKRSGKLLSDVVEASWQHLRRATHPISYLRTLLRAPVDFAYRLRTQRAAAESDQQHHDRALHVERTVVHLAGQAFASRDGMRTYHVSTDATSVTIHHRDEARPRVHAGNWTQDFVAAMEAGRIVAMEAAHSLHDTPRLSTSPQSKSAPSGSEQHMRDLRQFLRLKQAGIAPTKTARAGIAPVASSALLESARRPLSELLRQVSSVAVLQRDPTPFQTPVGLTPADL
ncbi:replication protein O [Caballeronia sp. LZ065]|uniref:replication protein O n=1 Tax=Caballeronia sp. LZ065 TaxID=3038571 RepID=UPI00285DE4AD|nr:replication protein O [Caballeronia sp. LZ065]MDR5781744.1 replication protein O [Caballeronia sp. LZ065]